jgi:hypothetical protein
MKRTVNFCSHLGETLELESPTQDGHPLLGCLAWQGGGRLPNDSSCTNLQSKVTELLKFMDTSVERSELQASQWPV